MFKEYPQRQAMIRARAAHDVQTFRSFIATVTQLTKRPITDLRILDLGCGSNAPMTALLHAQGCQVTGVDVELGFRWGLGFQPGRYVSFAKQSGLLKTARKAVGELIYDRTYYRSMSKLTGLRLSDNGLDLRAMDIQKLALPAATFDVVHSNATWEHIADVRAANRAVRDCLTPGGLAYIEIHLFPSLSGGHDLPWIVPGRTMLGEVRPWQHLWDPEWSAPVFLNRMRESDYRRAFEETPGLNIEQWQVEFTEGQDLLSADILEKLPAFSADELTRRSIIVVVRRQDA